MSGGDSQAGPLRVIASSGVSGGMASLTMIKVPCLEAVAFFFGLLVVQAWCRLLSLLSIPFGSIAKFADDDREIHRPIGFLSGEPGR